MRVLVTGAAGMVGRKLAERLARDGAINGTELDDLLLVDLVEPVGQPGRAEAADLAHRGVAPRLVAERPDVIFHLAAVVSGEAEEDFEKGYRVNLDATHALLDAIRAEEGYAPRLVFASSIAVFGAPLPEDIGDDYASVPQTSYGTQKAIAELLLGDYTRRGLVDGIGLRLPTVCVRPGAPNRAASGFFSSIIREPLVGEPAVLPVADDVRHWHASPRAAVGFLLHAATLHSERVGPRRSLTMPGVSVTVGEQLEALRRVAGDEIVGLISREPDEMIQRIVASWPRQFDTRRATELGFAAETSFDEIIRIHIEDELGG